MKVYDPRLDTKPGAHPDDERYHVETTNPMLLMTESARAAGAPIYWEKVVQLADVCDEKIGPPTVVDVLQGGKGSQ
jgi:hypothetical protein